MSDSPRKDGSMQTMDEETKQNRFPHLEDCSLSLYNPGSPKVNTVLPTEISRTSIQNETSPEDSDFNDAYSGITPGRNPTDDIRNGYTTHDPTESNDLSNGTTLEDDVQSDLTTEVYSDIVQDGTSTDVHYSNGFNVNGRTTLEGGLRRRFIPIKEVVPGLSDHDSESSSDEDIPVLGWSFRAKCKTVLGTVLTLVMSVVEFVRDCKYFLELCTWPDFNGTPLTQDE